VLHARAGVVWTLALRLSRILVQRSSQQVDIETMAERVQSESGFTLVELLVVMLILGILAAIAIPSFFNQREKAVDARAKTAARTAEEAIEVYGTDNEGSYNGADTARLVAIEGTLSDANLSVTAAAKTYTVTVDVPQTGNSFWIERKPNDIIEFGCTVINRGGCPASGRWDR
jgi:type IV pilus assembly protein PilA